MFGFRHRRHRLPRFGRLDDIVDFTHSFGARHGNRGAFGFRRRRGPSAARILLAGLAVFAFVKLMSAANRANRSTLEKVALGALIAIVGAVLLSYRNSARRYRW